MTSYFIQFTYKEAAKLKYCFVYGLSDGKEIFYVGKTTNAYSRFKDKTKHLDANLHLARRIRDAGESLRVLIIARDPEDILAAEFAAIQKYCPTLTNIARNSFKESSGDRMDIPKWERLFPPCSACDAPVDVRRSKYCRKCLGALLGYRGSSKQELRDLLQKLRA